MPRTAPTNPTAQTPQANGLQSDRVGDDLTIYLYAQIGPGWAGMIDDQIFAEVLRAAPDVKTIIVRINSPGGDVFIASTIYNLLREHSAEIETIVDGHAASAASVILMAGDRIRIADNGFVMIHKAGTISWGNADLMRKTANLLDKIDDVMVETYVARTGNDSETVLAWCTEETWFDANEAVEHGFADEKTGSVSGLKIEVPKGRFKNVPSAIAQIESHLPTAALLAPPPRPQRPTDGPDGSPDANVAPTRRIAARVAAARARFNLT